MDQKQQTVNAILAAARISCERSKYRSAPVNIKNAYIQGWLLARLADRWNSDPELRRDIHRILNQ